MVALWYAMKGAIIPKGIGEKPSSFGTKSSGENPIMEELRLPHIGRIVDS